MLSTVNLTPNFSVYNTVCTCAHCFYFAHVYGNKQIFEIDSSGTAAYLVVRGCVRLFSKANAATTDGKKNLAFTNIYLVVSG